MSDLHDPRVLFAAERTLLDWNRTSLALIGFGFLIERFGLFLHMLGRTAATLPTGTALVPPQAGGSAWLGLCFAVLGSVFALLSVRQYRQVVSTLNAAEIPAGYWLQMGSYCNLAVGLLGLVLAGYLAHLH